MNGEQRIIIKKMKKIKLDRLEWQNNINSVLSIEDAAAATKLQQSMCALPVATNSLHCLR